MSVITAEDMAATVDPAMDELSALPVLAPIFYGSELWREAMEKKSKEKVAA